VPGAFPIAFDGRGESLLVLAGQSDAWLVDAPWTADSMQPLRRGIRAGSLSPDGRTGSLVSDGGFVEVFERTDDGRIHWIGGYPMGAQPLSCAIDRAGCQLLLGSPAGFQILRWKQPVTWHTRRES
jgi:hypothetical protein